MDNLRNIIKIFFCYTSATEVLDGKTAYNEIRDNSFITLANTYIDHYSNNEIKNMRQFFKDEFQWHNNKMRGEEKDNTGRSENVFDAVLLFADNVLTEENGMPLCQYEHLLRWREMIIPLDEDLFVTAFLANKDLLSRTRRKNFFWPPVIGHNNKELNRLMQQGVAENHFHMKGSAPTFHLSWLSMMNDVMNPEFKKTFEKYEERRLHTKVSYYEQNADTLYLSYLKAALIRLYLFAELKQDVFLLKTDYVEKGRVLRLMDEAVEIECDDMEDGFVRIDKLPRYLSVQKCEMIKRSLMRRDVKELLLDNRLLLFYLPEINKQIGQMRDRYGKGQLDYAICESWLYSNPDRHLNEVISGERYFLYEVFKELYKENGLFKERFNWFYAYLLIKENIRAELIQCNENVGFDNFKLYQERKENFIDGTSFEKIYLKMAVKDTILNQHIKILEARISPKESSIRMRDAIRKNDRYILSDLSKEAGDGLKQKFFYVCHFIKAEDTEFIKEGYQNECRHYSKRREVRTQAQAIYECRRQYPDAGERIKGIDAASEEIVCRPEVFAQAFRYLKNDSVVHTSDVFGKEIRLPDLAVTYHVGEDFLDITDGLRAIDEAISFLNLDCGDRLGHALALGVDVDAWYEMKSDRILISQMDYLDNLVWLHAKIRKYRIENCNDAVRYIEKKYDEYFRVVYLNNMNQSYFESVMKKALKHYTDRGVKNNYGNSQCYFSINTYYDAWKLRGDDPEYFRSGFFQLNDFPEGDWDENGINRIFPENYRIRYNPEAAYLYHTYHYNDKVKREGNKKKEIKINVCIKKAVKEVQKRMQYEVAQRGICIETNPSSNALIGTFKRYDEHPILKWYNLGLVTDEDELRDVPQMQVSINTDDQGVFATYIENEYAYLALAIEKMRDENGNRKYSRTLIHRWLDDIRKMGLSQSFADVEW